jgi:hypothetical protein
VADPDGRWRGAALVGFVPRAPARSVRSALSSAATDRDARVSKEVVMRRLLWIPVALVAFLVAAAAWWRRHPRFGAAWVNRVVDPWLVRQGIVEDLNGEIALLEHVGRKSGIVRITPVHPTATVEGFRIVVPLGLESHWARNVLVAGHCRMQLGEVVYELDQPMLVSPLLIDGLPPMAQRMLEWLGFRVLTLRRFAAAAGTLTEGPAAILPEIEREAVAV